MTTLTKKPNTSDGYLAVATKVYVTVNNDLTPIWHKVEGLIYDLDYLLGLTVRLKNTGEVLASGYLPELLLQATGNEQHLSAGGVLHRAARAFVSHFAELTPEARPVWRRHVATYQADFDKPVILYLDYLLNLNVCDKKTGEVLDSGYLPDLLSRQDGAMAVADIYNLPPDTRPAQMERVAHYLEQHPDATCKEMDAACDTGCMTKVLSEMCRTGYGLARDWRYVPCDTGHATRRVRSYRLLYRPSTQPDLFRQGDGTTPTSPSLAPPPDPQG